MIDIIKKLDPPSEPNTLQNVVLSYYTKIHEESNPEKKVTIIKDLEKKLEKIQNILNKEERTEILDAVWNNKIADCIGIINKKFENFKTGFKISEEIIEVIKYFNDMKEEPFYQAVTLNKNNCINFNYTADKKDAYKLFFQYFKEIMSSCYSLLQPINFHNPIIYKNRLSMSQFIYKLHKQIHLQLNPNYIYPKSFNYQHIQYEYELFRARCHLSDKLSIPKIQSSIFPFISCGIFSLSSMVK
jgi:hypothetical protein